VILIDNPGGTNFSIYNDVILNAPLSIAKNSDGNYVLSFFGDISGSGGISKDFTFSTLRLTGNNTFEGNVIVNRGILEIGSDTALGRGTLVLGGAVSSGISAYNGAYVIENSMTVGGVAPTDTSTIAFSGSLTVNGSVTLDQGSAVNAKAKAMAAAGGAMVTFNGSIGQDTSAGGAARSLHLMGANVTEGSAGTFLINGDGAYAGETILGNAFGAAVNRAKVQINGDLSASSRTRVYSGMVLSGTGRIAALSVSGLENLGVAGFSIVDPGACLRGQSGAVADDLGILKVAGSADFLGGSSLRLQLGSAGVSDRLLLEDGGTLSLNATGTILSIDLLGGHALSGVYVLASYGELEGAFAEVYFNGLLVENPTEEGSFGDGYRLFYGEHQLVLIPEPNSTVLLAASLAMFGLLAGRKKEALRRRGQN
jgi:fibronectin-binding autotransporter adhesin